MCSIIQDAIKKFENQDEKEKLASDSLNAMMELAEQQKDAFYLKVTYTRSCARFEARTDSDTL